MFENHKNTHSHTYTIFITFSGYVIKHMLNIFAACGIYVLGVAECAACFCMVYGFRLNRDPSLNDSHGLRVQRIISPDPNSGNALKQTCHPTH